MLTNLLKCLSFYFLATHFGIALPKWIVEKQNSVWVSWQKLANSDIYTMLFFLPHKFGLSLTDRFILLHFPIGVRNEKGRIKKMLKTFFQIPRNFYV